MRPPPRRGLAGLLYGAGRVLQWEALVLLATAATGIALIALFGTRGAQLVVALAVFGGLLLAFRGS